MLYMIVVLDTSQFLQYFDERLFYIDFVGCYKFTTSIDLYLVSGADPSEGLVLRLIYILAFSEPTPQLSCVNMTPQETSSSTKAL